VQAAGVQLALQQLGGRLLLKGEEGVWLLLWLHVTVPAVGTEPKACGPDPSLDHSRTSSDLIGLASHETANLSSIPSLMVEEIGHVGRDCNWNSSPLKLCVSAHPWTACLPAGGD
jgi:hypothetical protein